MYAFKSKGVKIGSQRGGVSIGVGQLLEMASDNRRLSGF
jgi:hypothetical protein